MLSSPKGVQKQSHGCSCQGCKVTNHTLGNFPEPSGSCIRNLHPHTPEPSGTCLRNLHQHTPPEPTPAPPWNPPEPSGTFLRNLREPSSRTCSCTTLKPSGTFWNLPPEPAPATRTGTHRSLSGLKTPLAYAVGKNNQHLGAFRALCQTWYSILFSFICFTWKR